MSTIPKPIPAILIDADGVLHTLMNEEVDLFELGQVANVHRATHITFDEDAQRFKVQDARTGQTVHAAGRRSDAINWEIKNYQPGGERFNG